MEHTIVEKARVLSNDRRLGLGIRVRYASIAKGIIKASDIDKKYITARYRRGYERVTV